MSNPVEEIKIGFIYDVHIPELFGGLDVQIMRSTYINSEVYKKFPDRVKDIGIDLFTSTFSDEVEFFEEDLVFNIVDIVVL